jgi:hypothetical protein
MEILVYGDSSEVKEGHVIGIHVHVFNLFWYDPVICNPEGDSKW